MLDGSPPAETDGNDMVIENYSIFYEFREKRKKADVSNLFCSFYVFWDFEAPYYCYSFFLLQNRREIS